MRIVFTAFVLLFPILTFAESTALPEVKKISQDKLNQIYGIEKPLVAGEIDWSLPEGLCPLSQLEKLPNTWRSSLVSVESKIEAIYRFKLSPQDKRATLPEFTLLIQSDQDTLTIKHSNPRTTADASGIQIPWPAEHMREFYLEGQDGSSLWILIPPLKKCNTQTFLVCPRTFVPRNNLALTSYVPISAGFAATGKIDGLLALGANETGKAFAEISFSRNISSQAPVTKENLSSSPHVTLDYTSHAEDQSLEAPASQLNEEDLSAAISSNLIFTRSSGEEANIFSRSDFSYSKVILGAERKARFRSNPLNVEGGPCYSFNYSQTKGFTERKIG